MIPKLSFGRSGHESTRLIFGAAALYRANEKYAARALQMLLEAGVNHIDVAADYGDAERWVGTWMRAHRNAFFLASKTAARDYEGARVSIRRSLERLQTDHLDLLQFHNLTDDAGIEQVFDERGALRAVLEARDEGLLRSIGVTGHGTRAAAMQLQCLARFELDSVLLPYNFAMMSQPAYADDFEMLLETCEAQNVAVQTIKSIARRRWRESETRNTRTWYAALRAPHDIQRALHWALSRPGIFVNSPSDLNLLPSVLDAARNFDNSIPPSDEEMQRAALELGVEPLFHPGQDGVNTA